MTAEAPALSASLPRVVLAIADASLRRRVEAALGAAQAARSGDDEVIRIVDSVPAGASADRLIALVAETETAAAIEAGALAVLPVDAPAALIRLAVEAASAGFALLPAEWRGSFFAAPSAVAGMPADSAGLTAREREVLRLVAEGASNKEIARRLAISIHTAKFHVGSILAKLDATGRTDAVTQAVRLGLVML